jgi:hypothetical protein
LTLVILDLFVVDDACFVVIPLSLPLQRGEVFH